MTPDQIATAKATCAERKQNQDFDWRKVKVLYEARVCGVCVDVSPRLATLRRDVIADRNPKHHSVVIWALYPATGMKHIIQQQIN